MEQKEFETDLSCLMFFSRFVVVCVFLGYSRSLGILRSRHCRLIFILPRVTGDKADEKEGKDEKTAGEQSDQKSSEKEQCKPPDLVFPFWVGKRLGNGGGLLTMTRSPR